MSFDLQLQMMSNHTIVHAGWAGKYELKGYSVTEAATVCNIANGMLESTKKKAKDALAVLLEKKRIVGWRDKGAKKDTLNIDILLENSLCSGDKVLFGNLPIFIRGRGCVRAPYRYTITLNYVSVCRRAEEFFKANRKEAKVK